MFSRPPNSEYPSDHQKAIRFWIAAALGLAVAILANVVPYIQTYGTAGFDGTEIIGFPFVFRSFGGFSGQFEFSHLALSIDIAVAIVFSIVAGTVAKHWVSPRMRRKRFAWCAGPPPARRRPWQISLRQMLLAVVIVSAAFAADKYIAAIARRFP